MFTKVKDFFKVMKVTDFWKEGKFTYSAELLPPKKNNIGSDDDADRVNKFVQKGIRLAGYVDFMSITMGAGGKVERSEPFLLASLIRKGYREQGYSMEVVSHFTCFNLSRAEVDKKIDHLSGLELENVLALLGDVPDIERDKQQKNKKGDFRYASDLVEHILKTDSRKQFCIGVAAYPNGYNEDGDIDYAAKILKTKFCAGADYAITQMIFDADVYGRFLEKASEQKIDVQKNPILPGVFLAKSYEQCKYLTERFNVKIPFMNELEGKSKEESKEIAANYTVQLCEELKNKGAPGVHLFTLNDICFTKRILTELRNKSTPDIITDGSMVSY